MSKVKQMCPHCGATMVSYPHCLSNGQIRSLWKVAKRYGTKPVHLVDAGLTYSQHANLYKLKYWGIITPPENGTVQITDVGMQFIRGEIPMHKCVRSYRGAFIGYGKYDENDVLVDEMVYPHDVSAGYMWRADYARESRPINGDLFSDQV